MVRDSHGVQNVEGEKCDVRRLQNIAARIENDLGRIRILKFDARILAEPREFGFGQLHPRKGHHVSGDDTKSLYPLFAPLLGRVLRPRPSQTRQR